MPTGGVYNNIVYILIPAWGLMLLVLTNWAILGPQWWSERRWSPRLLLFMP